MGFPKFGMNYEIMQDCQLGKELRAQNEPPVSWLAAWNMEWHGTTLFDFLD